MTDATIRPEDIRWRVGQVSKKDPHKGSLLGYIDARTCMEALDALDPEWSAVHGDPIIVGDVLMGVPCTVTVNGVRRSDVGMPSSQEPIKGAYSDALKRAAVHFGIGRELYELPRIWVTLDDYKRPVATPTFRNGRWTLPSGQGSVFYDREPEQPEQGTAAVAGRRRPEPRGPAPAPRTPAEQALLDQILAVEGMTKARMSLMADAAGVPKGERANEEQLRAMVALIDQPLPAQAATALGEAGEHPASPDALLESVLEVTGGELIQPSSEAVEAGPEATPSSGPPPKPGTPEFEALSSKERVNARAYWQTHSDDEEPTLAEQLQVPA